MIDFDRKITRLKEIGTVKNFKKDTEFFKYIIYINKNIIQ